MTSPTALTLAAVRDPGRLNSTFASLAPVLADERAPLPRLLSPFFFANDFAGPLALLFPVGTLASMRMGGHVWIANMAPLNVLWEESS